MTARRLFAIARKEYHHITRDARILFLVTIAPAFMLLTLAYIFSLDAEHFNLLILDRDNSSLSRQYIADLTSDRTFRIVGYADSYKDIDAWLQSGRAHLALIIPPGAGDSVQAGRSASVQAVVDGTDAIIASQLMGQLNARTNVFALTLLPAVSNQKTGLDIRTRAWYNPPLKSLPGMVPGLAAIVLYMPALALALSLTREKELGSFEGLAATPVRGAEYLLGKVLTFTGFGLVSIAPVMLVAIGWFHVPFKGDLLSLIVLAVFYFLASFGLGIIVANSVKSQQVAMLIMILVFFVPSFFLAGLILPVDKDSPVVEAAAYSLPVTHFIVICRGIFLKGLSLTELLSPAAALLSISGVTLAVSLARFRKQIG